MFAKRLHSLKSVDRGVNLNVVVEWGTYRAICNNYRIIENYLQSGSNTYIVASRNTHKYLYEKVWLHNI
jgi:hypothetical protein